MRRWVGFVLVIAFVSLLLVWVWFKAKQGSPISQVQRELMRLQKLREPTKLSDLLPPVPISQDGTLLYRYAIAQLEMAEKNLPRHVLDSIYDFISKQPTKPLNLADVQKVLRETQPALQTLRKALNYPHMRMTDWSIENPMNIMFPHFSKFREFTRLLVAEGKWKKRQGDIDGAVESHLTALKLVRRMGDEPSLIIGFLVQGAIFSTAISGLQQVLSDADASPKSYRKLLDELKAWDINRDLVRSLQSERVFAIITCDWMNKKASRKWLSRLTSISDPFPSQVNMAVWLRGKSNLIALNELKILKCYEEMLLFARKGEPYDWEEMKRREGKWMQEIDRPVKGLNLGGVRLVWDENAIVKSLMPVMTNLFQKSANIRALQQLAQVAVALRLYRHEHGYYPETLRELVPKYFPSVPIDPFDGKPLRYKRLRQGFKIWSIGQDLKDDGGVEGKPRWVNGDIVWEATK